MQKNSRKIIAFSSSRRRTLEADFDGDHVSSDSGLLLVREADRKLNLIRAAAARSEARRIGAACGGDHAALTGTRVRWVIVKAEHTDKGSNPRFVITNIVGDP
ncbi:MAG: hypothetical protein ABSF76_11420 [Opitutaceae bacterium]|jgi:hypothetical protein